MLYDVEMVINIRMVRREVWIYNGWVGVMAIYIVQFIFGEAVDWVIIGQILSPSQVLSSSRVATLLY